MAFQYIHTSAKRGIEPGKSGFCCVARNRALSPELARILEKLSCYESHAHGPGPLILRYASLSTRDGRQHILSRIQDSGPDYSKRNNHIAHHLVFDSNEIHRLPDPATILLYWKNWRDDWNEPPRILQERDDFRIQDIDTSIQLTDFRLDLAPAIEKGKPRSRSYAITAGHEIAAVEHWRQALAHLPAERRWSYPFTNALLSTDHPGDYFWAAYRKGHTLPYDVPEEPIRSELAAPTQGTHPEPSAPPPPPVKKAAPIVEIPTAVPFKKRRRKRPGQQMGMSRWLNGALAILALSCAGIAAHFFFRYQSPLPDGLDLDLPPPSRQPPPPTSQEAEAIWNALSETGRWREDGRQAALALAKAGNPEPLATVELLDSIAAAPPGQSVSVPGTLIRRNGNAAELDPALARHLAAQGRHLATKRFAEAWPELLSYPREAPIVVERLVQLGFRPDDLIIALKECRRRAKDRRASGDPVMDERCAAFEVLRTELENAPALRPVREIHRVMGLPDHEGFIALDADGHLASPSALSYAAHLRALFQTFILPRTADIQPSMEFRLALQKANSERPKSAEQSALDIGDALKAAEPKMPDLRKELEALRAQWDETFLKDDLMEQALVHYAIERLEAGKARLAALQQGIAPDALGRHRELTAVLAAIDQAEQALMDASTQEEWVVMPVQTTQPTPQD